MLRITIPTASHPGLFILEGRLTGLWAKELLRVARGTSQETGTIFDLREVFYVDSEGEDALQSLDRRRAKFITESAYGKNLCNRLRLHRVTASNVDNEGAKGPGRSREFRRRQTGHGQRLDAPPRMSTSIRSGIGSEVAREWVPFHPLGRRIFLDCSRQVREYDEYMAAHTELKLNPMPKCRAGRGKG